MDFNQDNTLLVDGIHYALLDDSHRNEVVNFYNEVYEAHRTQKVFDWLMNGPEGKTIYVIARDTMNDNKIVGSQCAIPIYLANNFEKMVLTAKSEDTLVHPAYRGRKIFKYMYEILFALCHKIGIEYIWGFTDAANPFKAIGFETPYAICKSYSILGLNALNALVSSNPNNKLHYSKSLIFVLLAKIKSLKRHFFSTSLKKFRIESEWIDDLETLQQNQYSIHDNLFFIPFKNQNYLEWRILNVPNEDRFRVFSLRDMDKILRGYILFSIDTENIAYLMLELYDEKLTEKEILSFLSYSARCLSKEKVSMIKTWNFDTNIKNQETILRHSKVGFWHVRPGMALVWKNLGEGNSIDVKNINFNLLASLGIRQS
jgi:GNAT superfamily N-acetyltransferase